MLLWCCLVLCAQTKHISVSASIAVLSHLLYPNQTPLCVTVSAFVTVLLSHFLYPNQTPLCVTECQCRFVVSFPVPKSNNSVCHCECHCRCVVVSFPVPKPNASLCVTLRVPLMLCCCLILCTQTKHISVCDCECQCCCGVVSFCVHKPNTSVSANVTVLSHFVYTNQTHLCV